MSEELMGRGQELRTKLCGTAVSAIYQFKTSLTKLCNAASKDVEPS